MHKSATKCNETVGKWCKNKHGASKIIDTLETYQSHNRDPLIELNAVHLFLASGDHQNLAEAWFQCAVRRRIAGNLTKGSSPCSFDSRPSDHHQTHQNTWLKWRGTSRSGASNPTAQRPNPHEPVSSSNNTPHVTFRFKQNSNWIFESDLCWILGNS
jgi:hypothetical protein